MAMNSGPVSIRRTRRDDLKACADIVNDYVDDTDWLPRVHSRDAVEIFFQRGFDAGREMWLAERDGRIVGYLSAEPKDPPAYPYVHALYLRPEARRAGIGKALLDKAKALFPGGFELSRFEPNTDARRFYEREGLMEIRELRNDETEEGVSELRMRWQGSGA